MVTQVSVREAVLGSLSERAHRRFVTVLAPREAEQWGCNILHELPEATYAEVLEALLRLLLDGRISIGPDKFQAGVLHLHYRYQPGNPEEAEIHRKAFGAVTA